MASPERVNMRQKRMDELVKLLKLVAVGEKYEVNPPRERFIPILAYLVQTPIKPLTQ
jgi:hypothetical protein